MTPQFHLSRYQSTCQGRSVVLTSMDLVCKCCSLMRGLIGIVALCIISAVGCRNATTADVGSKSPTKKPSVDHKQALAKPTKGVQPHPQTSEFNQNRLSKDHTLFVVAFDSVTRQDYFLSKYQWLITQSQTEQVQDLVDSFELDFKRLRDQRASILETARDGQDTELLLKNNRIEIVLLSRQVHGSIYREILSEEQCKRYMSEYKSRSAVKKGREQSQE